jgi:hypothetical protein
MKMILFCDRCCRLIHGVSATRKNDGHGVLPGGAACGRGTARGRWSMRRMRRSARLRSGWRRTGTCGRRTRSAVMRPRWRSGGRSWSSAASPAGGLRRGSRQYRGFLSWLCNGRTVEHAVAAPAGVPSADTLHARLAALISFYQWQEASTRCRSRDGCCAGGLPGCRHGDCSRTWTRGVRVARHRWSRSAVTGGTGLRCCCRGRSRRSSTAAPPGMRRPGTGAGTCVTGCCSRCWPRAG